MVIEVGDILLGGSEFAVMAGPCAVESERQLMEIAEGVAQCGARILRGGAFKPRTSPYSFQGLGEEGLKLLAKARHATGLAIVTEVMTDTQVGIVAEYADILQIGSRSMENYVLLRAAARSGRPMLLKRGMMATIEEFAAAAEFAASEGCRRLILCERGIRTYGTTTRNTCDLMAVPLLKRMTPWPVILDPSHATGRSSLVPLLSHAAVAVEADGLLVEVHCSPENALSDGEQSLTIPQFEALMCDLQPQLKLWKQKRAIAAACPA